MSQIAEIESAIQAGKLSYEYKTVLEKYGAEKVNFVDQNGSGDYALFPESSDPNETEFFTGTTYNVTQWNIPKYMVGTQDEDWMKNLLKDDAMSVVALYVALLSTE